MSRDVSAIYNAPKPRQEWVNGRFVQDEERSEEAWVELFIDLVYVVLLSKLGNIVHVCPINGFYFWKLLTIFGSICLTRQAIDEYSNRFYSHDLLHKLIYLVYTAGLLIQVLNINAEAVHVEYIEVASSNSTTTALSPHAVFNQLTRSLSGSTDETSSATTTLCPYDMDFGVGIAIGVLITRISIISIYMLVFQHNPRAQRQFVFDVVRWSITSVLMAASIVSHSWAGASETSDTALLAVSVGVEIVVWVASRSLFRHRFTYPIDLENMQKRWGVWLLLVIGEAIIQLLYPNPVKENLTQIYVFGLVAFALMFSLAMQYYDACQVEWFDHALTKSALAGCSWIWLHLPMTFFIFRVGAMLPIFHEAYRANQQIEEDLSSSFSISLGCATICLTLIRLTNTTIYRMKRREALTYGLRLLLSGIQLTVGEWGVLSPTLLFGIHTMISIVGFNVIDIVHEVSTVEEAQQSKTNFSAANSNRRSSRPWAFSNFSVNNSMRFVGPVAKLSYSVRAMMTPSVIEDQKGIEGFDDGEVQELPGSNSSSDKLEELVQLDGRRFDGMIYVRTHSGDLMPSMRSFSKAGLSKSSISSRSKSVHSRSIHSRSLHSRSIRSIRSVGNPSTERQDLDNTAANNNTLKPTSTRAPREDRSMFHVRVHSITADTATENISRKDGQFEVESLPEEVENV